MSSTLAHRPSKDLAAGAGIPAAVKGLTRALAVELAPIRVNAVAPGIIRTPLWQRIPVEERERFFESRGAALPAGRVGRPADAAAAYMYAMSADFVTGQSLVVDGGMLLT